MRKHPKIATTATVIHPPSSVNSENQPQGLRRSRCYRTIGSRGTVDAGFPNNQGLVLASKDGCTIIVVL